VQLVQQYIEFKFSRRIRACELIGQQRARVSLYLRDRVGPG
jgi:hypothetical protein